MVNLLSNNNKALSTETNHRRIGGTGHALPEFLPFTDVKQKNEIFLDETLLPNTELSEVVPLVGFEHTLRYRAYFGHASSGSVFLRKLTKSRTPVHKLETGVYYFNPVGKIGWGDFAKDARFYVKGSKTSYLHEFLDESSPVGLLKGSTAFLPSTGEITSVRQWRNFAWFYKYRFLDHLLAGRKRIGAGLRESYLDDSLMNLSLSAQAYQIGGLKNKSSAWRANACFKSLAIKRIFEGLNGGKEKGLAGYRDYSTFFKKNLKNVPKFGHKRRMSANRYALRLRFERKMKFANRYYHQNMLVLPLERENEAAVYFDYLVDNLNDRLVGGLLKKELANGAYRIDSINRRFGKGDSKDKKLLAPFKKKHFFRRFCRTFVWNDFNKDDCQRSNLHMNFFYNVSGLGVKSFKRRARKYRWRWFRRIEAPYRLFYKKAVSWGGVVVRSEKLGRLDSAVSDVSRKSLRFRLRVPRPLKVFKRQRRRLPGLESFLGRTRRRKAPLRR